MRRDTTYTARHRHRGDIYAGPTYPVGGNQDAVKYKDETVGRYSVVVLDAKAFRLGELPRRPSSLNRSCAHSKVRAEQPGGKKRFRRSERLAHVKGNPSSSADVTPRTCDGNTTKSKRLIILYKALTLR